MRPTESTRAMPLAFLVVLGLLLVARGATAWWEGRHPPESYDRVDWKTPAEALEVSAMHRKPILYDFTADWCAPCQKMKGEVFADQNRAKQIGMMFVPARVLDRQQEDGRNPADVDSLQQKYAITAFPTLIAVTPDGREVGRVLGYPGSRATMDSLMVFYRRSADFRISFPDSSPAPSLGI